MFDFNVNLNLYKSFYYVAKYEGFNKASIAMCISQSTLSSNIKKLEDELGIKLFNRLTNSIELTKEGKDLYQKLIEIYHIFNRLQTTEISIGVLRFIADNYLSSSIVDFNIKNKNTKINININDSGTLFQLLKRGQLDIVISRYPNFYNFDKNITIEKLLEAKNILVCSKKFYQSQYFDEKNKKLPLSIILPTNSEKRRTIEKYLNENNIRYNITVEVDNSMLLKELIINGLGIGYVNEIFVKNEIKNGDLIILDQFCNLPTDSICILYDNKKKHEKLSELIEILKNDIKKIDN